MQKWWNIDNCTAKWPPNEGIFSQNFLREDLIVNKSQEWNYYDFCALIHTYTRHCKSCCDVLNHPNVFLHKHSLEVNSLQNMMDCCFPCLLWTAFYCLIIWIWINFVPWKNGLFHARNPQSFSWILRNPTGFLLDYWEACRIWSKFLQWVQGLWTQVMPPCLYQQI